MTPKFILQGITDRSHVDAVQHVMALPNLDQAILSVAFVTAPGLGAIEEKLAPIAERTTMFAGIRNGITSAQALQKCLDLGLATYIVDTGARSILFHPKLYLSNRLEISHNMRTDTPTYRQGNGMTALHWGAARPIVAQESLLERTMQLYRDADDPEGKSFILEID